MLSVLLTIVHVLVCLFLIGVVLLQTGKRADLAGAFGGGGSQTAFGARGAATALSKMTTGGAVLFMVTSIFLTVAYTGGDGGSSPLDAVAPPAAEDDLFDEPLTDDGSTDAGDLSDPYGTVPADPVDEAADPTTEQTGDGTDTSGSEQP